MARGRKISLACLVCMLGAAAGVYWASSGPSRTSEILNRNAEKYESKLTQHDDKKIVESSLTPTVQILLAGESITVQLKNIVFDNHEFYPIENLSNVYEQLASQARSGNMLAANALADGLKSCEKRYSSVEEAKRAIAMLSSDFVYSTPQIDYKEIPITVEDVAELEVEIMRNFEFCKNITDSQVGEYLMWGELSASSGNFLGIDFMVTAKENDYLNSFKWLNKAWTEEGHVGSAGSLAVHFAQGWFPNAEGKISEPDYQRAYAYHLISTVVGLKSRQLVDPDSILLSSYMVEVDEVDQYLTSYLSPFQQLEAEKMAASILKQNQDKCCLGVWSTPDQTYTHNRKK